jgi:small conductance mechanosensitive channel
MHAVRLFSQVPQGDSASEASVDLDIGRAREVCQDNLVCRWMLDVTGSDTVAPIIGGLVLDVLRTAFIFFIAWVAVRVARRLIRHLVREMVESNEAAGSWRRRMPLVASTQSMDPRRAAMRTETIGTVLKSVASMVIWTVAVLVAAGSLSFIAINLTPLIAGAGILGLAFGFGAQSLVKDFLTGIFMLLEDQYGVGDIIDAGPATGVVEGITLRTTRLRDIEGVLWHIPNGEISRVGNLSQQWSRSLLDIPVGYQTDIPHAIDVIKRTADGLWDDPDWRGEILAEPEVWGVEAFADSAILIRLVLKTVPAKQWAVSRELRLRLKDAFDRADIEIPFPQRTVWMRQESDQHRQPTVDDDGFLPAYRPQRSAEYDMEPPRSSQHDETAEADQQR